ncbi:restriction endonuclease subunit S [Pseudenhygromyxa sp. WMMC2535]|uniref:restriction endonuclease subunit S n=1 Tax=Pseudenhygromyxa sp. WMMC2535 TaxID=2712867 RepID=UPI0015961B8C|nr:restriction endonuclease subunit S [Pseudenhygromyxa sp. WMMC2535]
MVALEYGKPLPAKGRRPGSVAVYGSNGIVGQHDDHLIDGPAIVVGRKGSVGKVCWSGGSCWPIDTTYYVSPQVQCDLKWVFYLLKEKKLSRLNSATGVPGLNRNDAYLLSVATPPLAEQRKIAAILSSVDEAIEKTQAVIEQVQVVKRGLMQELLTKGLPGRHKRFKRTEIGEIPADWEVAPLGGVLEKVIDYRGKTPPKSESGIPLLSAANIGMGRVKMEPRQFISPTDYDAWTTRGLTRPGDILITTEAPVGHVAPYPENGTYQISRRVMALRPNAGQVLSKYLIFVLLADDAQSRLLDKTRGSTVPRVLKPDILGLPIPMPSLSEQAEISHHLDSTNSYSDALMSECEFLHVTKQALMSVLLTGELRVTP